jgi:hypothetical protein
MWFLIRSTRFSITALAALVALASACSADIQAKVSASTSTPVWLVMRPGVDAFAPLDALASAKVGAFLDLESGRFSTATESALSKHAAHTSEKRFG